jgi:hypothetical protein
MENSHLVSEIPTFIFTSPAFVILYFFPSSKLPTRGTHSSYSPPLFLPHRPLPPAPFPPSLSRNPTLARRGGMRLRRPPPSPLPFSAGAPRRPGIHDDELAPSNRAPVSPSASPPSFSPLHLCSRRIRRGRGASTGPRPARALRIRRWRIQSIGGLLRRRRGGASSSMGSSPRRPRAASSPARRPKMQGHGAPSRPPRAKSLGGGVWWARLLEDGRHLREI